MIVIALVGEVRMKANIFRLLFAEHTIDFARKDEFNSVLGKLLFGQWIW